MNILFASNDPYLPQRYGGAYVSMHELALGLTGRGHDVSIIARLVPGGRTYLMNRVRASLSGKRFPSDRLLGYRVFRGWGTGVPSGTCHGLEEVVSKVHPDIVVAQGGQSMNLAIKATKLGFPSVVYLRDVEFSELSGDPHVESSIAYISNSEFTARRFFEAFRINSTVIPPLVHQRPYKVISSRDTVLFINPNPKKGLMVAVALAKARPDINFIFQESWFLTDTTRRIVEKAVSSTPNIELRAPKQDMRDVYRRARIVLAPSQWDEAWGRIATEAQISGIPVLASDRGGLPESVGNGGIVLPFDAPIDLWLSALSQLWDDKESYESYCKQSLERSTREDISPSFLLSKLESKLEEMVVAHHRSKKF